MAILRDNLQDPCLVGYADSSYSSDPDTRKSTTGYVFLYNGGAVSWGSRLQQTVAMSTMEAEYMAAAAAAKEGLWFRKLMEELQLQQDLQDQSVRRSRRSIAPPNLDLSLRHDNICCWHVRCVICEHIWRASCNVYNVNICSL
ncbi:hypothetical protein CEUSTIGMA_g2342.t1 [Chlamydomonas eustigma]|uniref:Reverse transcriptase Ty1/copia-type domain-containing protein n=1 Tax=Chlamydomonas eustigma TaxID=1157962 RepID=A0A250WVV8_9CHLO|nr:hypothetical protein CEUSTIGMA_g2342.t1 [Chlamydomonas eustigma]|eukprot:GAX74896.1 hypothetical protein CEUSTIGMA_g2342.t1 [Chlamydomonas eustigma]